jgi:hypothetical protein
LRDAAWPASCCSPIAASTYWLPGPALMHPYPTTAAKPSQKASVACIGCMLLNLHLAQSIQSPYRGFCCKPGELVIKNRPSLSARVEVAALQIMSLSLGKGVFPTRLGHSAPP